MAERIEVLAALGRPWEKIADYAGITVSELQRRYGDELVNGLERVRQRVKAASYRRPLPERHGDPAMAEAPRRHAAHVTAPAEALARLHRIALSLAAPDDGEWQAKRMRLAWPPRRMGSPSRRRSASLFRRAAHRGGVTMSAEPGLCLCPASSERRRRALASASSRVARASTRRDGIGSPRRTGSAILSVSSASDRIGSRSTAPWSTTNGPCRMAGPCSRARPE
jgi:hypothetical protein